MPAKGIGFTVDIDISLGNVAVNDIRVDIALVDIFVVCEQFTVYYGDFCAGFSRNTDIAVTGDIFAEVINRGTIAQLPKICRRNFLHFPALRAVLFGNDPRRR